MKKYEYVILDTSDIETDEGLIDELNLLGAEGWRVASHKDFYFLLMRETPSDES